MKEYAAKAIDPYMLNRGAFEFVADSAVRDAIEDGVVLFEMSFDIRAVGHYEDGLDGLIPFVESLSERFSRQIELRPELGISRLSLVNGELVDFASEAIRSGAFHSIDLYDDENACSPDAALSLYGAARAEGLKLKAHVGEFKDAKAVRRTVEVLQLDEVQHGIAVAESVEVMNWIANRGVRLNVCPSSSVALGAVARIKEHPIRTIYDHGIPITVNTDDLMLFDQTVSDGYLTLFTTGVFTAEELDGIRTASIKSSK